MERFGILSKILRFFYTQFFIRFSKQIRDPYIIRVDAIDVNALSNEVTVSFHVANKRVSREMPVSKFVASDMIYLIDPRTVFDMGTIYGSHSEKLKTQSKPDTSLKKKCIHGLKRVFIDE